MYILKQLKYIQYSCELLLNTLNGLKTKFNKVVANLQNMRQIELKSLKFWRKNFDVLMTSYEHPQIGIYNINIYLKSFEYY